MIFNLLMMLFFACKAEVEETTAETTAEENETEDVTNNKKQETTLPVSSKDVPTMEETKNNLEEIKTMIKGLEDQEKTSTSTNTQSTSDDSSGEANK